ncbi:hypothetical protein MMC29_008108 [Sticta canariensis]|nr:hypothetical protein [Sticta canariensis]
MASFFLLVSRFDRIYASVGQDTLVKSINQLQAKYFSAHEFIALVCRQEDPKVDTGLEKTSWLNFFVDTATTGNDIAVGDSFTDVPSANASSINVPSADAFSADAFSADAPSNGDALPSGRPKRKQVELDQFNSDADQLYSYQSEEESSINEDRANELSDFDENSDPTNNIAGIEELTLESISTKIFKAKYNKLDPKEQEQLSLVDMNFCALLSLDPDKIYSVKDLEDEETLDWTLRLLFLIKYR